MLQKALTVSICIVTALSSIYFINTAQAKYKKDRYDYQSMTSKVLHRTYVGIKGGVSAPVAFSFSPGDVKDLNSSAVYGGVVGFRVNKWFRSDIELSHRHTSKARREPVSGSGGILSQTTELSSTYTFLNGYAMLPQMYAQPFVTAGIGLSSNKLTDYKVNGVTEYPGSKKTSFAYQIGTGLTFSHENIDVDGTVQFINHGEAKTKSVGEDSDSQARKVKFRDFVFALSLRYNL
jgi:hypothetical protein